MAPRDVGTFADYDLVSQWEAQIAASMAGVPVADPVIEVDTSWLGYPFIVMPRVHGHIIGQMADRDPWLRGFDSSPARMHLRRALGDPGDHPPGRPRRPTRYPDGTTRRNWTIGTNTSHGHATVGPSQPWPAHSIGAEIIVRSTSRPPRFCGVMSDSKTWCSTTAVGPWRCWIGHDLSGRTRARPGLVHQSRLHHARLVREAGRRFQTSTEPSLNSRN